MAASKFTKSFVPISDEFVNFAAGRFRILAVPMRLRILHSLQRGELTVSQVMEATGASQANASKHLGVMTRAEMLKRRKDGLHVYYSIADPVIFELCELVCIKEQSTRKQSAAW